jgi:very-short-patch-repair endonuclease
VKRLKDPKYYQKQFDTKIELQFKNFLESHHLAYEGQFVLQTAIGQFCFDFYIPGSNMLVEIDGEYWHSKSCEQINRDRLKLKLAHKAGYLCVRISDQDWRPEIIFQSPDSINLHNTQLITSRLEKLQKGSS